MGSSRFAVGFSPTHWARELKTDNDLQERYKQARGRVRAMARRGRDGGGTKES